MKEAPYKTGTIDFTPHMNAMREAKADTIVLWTYLPQSAAIIKQKAKMGWKVDLISNNTTGVPYWAHSSARCEESVAEVMIRPSTWYCSARGSARSSSSPWATRSS